MVQVVILFTSPSGDCCILINCIDRYLSLVYSFATGFSGLIFTIALCNLLQLSQSNLTGQAGLSKFGSSGLRRCQSDCLRDFCLKKKKMKKKKKQKKKEKKKTPHYTGYIEVTVCWMSPFKTLCYLRIISLFLFGKCLIIDIDP